MTSVLLTTSDAALIGAIGRAMPDARVFAIQQDLPAGLPAGPAWCFVDWILPDTSGLEICRRIRSGPATATVHVTMVLEADDQAARRRALWAGADDYMLGPLSAERLEARLRDYGGVDRAVSPATALSDLALDPDAHQVRWRGRLVTLRPREFALLAVFLGHPDKLLSRARLIALVGRDCGISDERTVDVWVGRLRRSLSAQGVPRIVRTVRSFGYVFDTPELAV